MFSHGGSECKLVSPGVYGWGGVESGGEELSRLVRYSIINFNELVCLGLFRCGLFMFAIRRLCMQDALSAHFTISLWVASLQAPAAQVRVLTVEQDRLRARADRTEADLLDTQVRACGCSAPVTRSAAKFLESV